MAVSSGEGRQTLRIVRAPVPQRDGFATDGKGEA